MSTTATSGSLGRKLTLIIILVFGLYLLLASFFAYLVYSQYVGLTGATGRHFERAMIAGELTRDAETIAGEVYELLAGNDISVSTVNSRVANLAGIYQATRKRLEQLGELSDSDRMALDKWQTPFFSSLDKLNERLRAEQELLPMIFEQRRPLLRHARATLATARETRVLAQKLTSATFSYHQRLKASAEQALQQQQRLMGRSMSVLLAALVLLVITTLMALLYIRRAIIQRINRLSRAMQAHGRGEPEPIPVNGDDEISRMGKTFAFFVDARQRAEQQLALANKELQSMNAALQRLSEIDDLTQIANRRCFDRHLEAEWRRAVREQRSLGLIMGDIDYFKRFNDEYGHQQGDECLFHVAQALAGELHRQGDMVARYGGEEFIVVLPEQDLWQTRHVAECLLNAVRELNIAHSRSEHQRVTLSLGVVAMVPGQYDRIEDMVARADKALYAAKEKGRNGLCVAPPECRTGQSQPV